MFAASLRFGIASLILWAVWFFCSKRKSEGGLRWMALCGLLNGLNYALIYAAEEHISGAIAAVLYATLPLFVAFTATVARVERVTARDIVGACIAIIGIFVLTRERSTASVNGVFGISLLLLSIFTCAVYNVIFKKTSTKVSSLSGLAVFFSFSTIFLIATTLLWEGPVLPERYPFTASMAILYLAVFGSVIAFAAYFALLRRSTLMTAATLTFVQPIFAILVDAAFEKEIVLGPSAYAGVGITLVGVAVSRLFFTTPRPS